MKYSLRVSSTQYDDITFLVSVRVAGTHRGVGLGVAVERRVVALIISLLPRSSLISLYQISLC